jgi:hypothetical protein
LIVARKSRVRRGQRYCTFNPLEGAGRALEQPADIQGE